MMGIGTFTNPSVIPLQATWLNLDGSPKIGGTTVASSAVRVLRGSGAGTVTEVLASTPLVQIPGTSTFQFLWVAPPLTVAENLLVEYTATDSDGATGKATETLTIFNQQDEDASVLAALTALDGKVETILDVDLGRQKLDPTANTWTLYRRNGTVLKVFDVTDDLNQPNTEDIFERDPQP